MLLKFYGLSSFSFIVMLDTKSVYVDAMPLLSGP